ncbi:MAG: MFS transporter [Actinomycetota bacterium]
MTAGGSKKYPGLRDLASHPRFRRLIGAQAFSQAGDGLYQIAIASFLIFSVEAARTPGQVTKILAVTTIPFSIVGPFTGPFIDRFSRRSVLVGSKIAMVILTLAIIPAREVSEGLVLALVVADVSVNRFWHAAKNAVLPSLVPQPRYLLANAVSTTTGMVASLGGAVIGGPIVDATTPIAGLVAGAACMAISAYLVAGIPLPAGEKRGLSGILSELRENLRDVRDGLRTLRASRQASYGVTSVWAMRFLLGFVMLASLVLLRERFDIQATGFSLVFAALAIGGFAGALLVPIVAKRLGYKAMAPVAMVLAAVAAMVGGPIPSLYALLPTVLIGGIAMSLAKIASDTLIQNAIEDRFRGRAFAVYELGYNGAFVVAGLIPTALRPVLGDVGVIMLTGALALVTAAVLYRRASRIPEQIEVHSYAGSRGDETPREVVIAGETFAVEEVERSWHEERNGKRFRVFRLRLSGGRRVQVSLSETWQLDSRG